MFLFLSNQTTRVQGADDEESMWLSSYLQFEDSTNAFYMHAGRVQHSGSKRRHFYNQGTKRFPAGLTALVYREAKKEGFDVQVVDERQKPADLDPTIDLDWLKERKMLDGVPFQYNAVTRAMTRTRGLLWLPTGSGKTEIAVGIMKAVPALRWLFLAPETDLMFNAQKRWESRTGEPAGLVGGGKFDPDHRVVCATFQTLAARLKNPDKRQDTIDFLSSFQGVIVDEVHQLPADDFYTTVLQVPAYYRFGMSGTALSRGDKKNMFILAALGEVIYRVEPKTLIAAGWIALPNVRFIPVVQGAPKASTYNGAYSECIVRCAKRNKVLVKVAEKCKKPALLFVKHEKHGRELMRRIKASGKITADFMHGKLSMPQRDQMIKDLQWGRLDVIVCTKVLQTGTDIPELGSLVIGTAGASNIEAVQRVGRGMRVVIDPDTGEKIKTDVDVWEIYDQDAKVKGPTGRMRQTKMGSWFEKHAKQRMQSYQGEGYPTVLLTNADAVEFGSVNAS